MPNWSSQDPSSFGWQHGAAADIVPFVYQGRSFPGGVARGTEPLFTAALDRICAQPGFILHPNPDPNIAGNWGYENRMKTSGNGWSFHAYGLAIDVHAPWNPYGSSQPSPSPYRLPGNTSTLVRDLGIMWGAEFDDWMHLEIHATPAEVEAIAGGQPAGGDNGGGGGGGGGGLEPPIIGAQLPPWLLSGGMGYAPRFPLPGSFYFGERSNGVHAVSGYGLPATHPYRRWLAAAQARLRTAADGLFGPNTAAWCRSFQRQRGLNPDALLGPRTWATLF